MELTAARLAGYSSPFDELVGTRLAEASGERVVATLDLSARHLEPAGTVHAGVYATVVESTASVGATLALGGGAVAIGVSNATRVLAAVSHGALRFEAVPVHAGRSLQVWQVEVTAGGRRVAYGKVTLFNRRPRQPAAGTLS